MTSRGKSKAAKAKDEEFGDYLKSDVADIKNCAENRLAGTGSAAYFLQQFVSDVPWLHLDIAFVASSTHLFPSCVSMPPWPYVPLGV